MSDPKPILYGACGCPRCKKLKAAGPWRWLWGAWLVAFLLVELPAAFAERAGGAKTLSRTVGLYYQGWRLYPLVVFLQTSQWHFVAMVLGVRPPWFGAAAIVVTGVPVLLLFAAGVLREGRA